MNTRIGLVSAAAMAVIPSAPLPVSHKHLRRAEALERESPRG